MKLTLQKSTLADDLHIPNQDTQALILVQVLVLWHYAVHAKNINLKE
jgi:hypothetical protein